MSRLHIILIVTVLTAHPVALAQSKPNIILVMSDDQGFVDVGYNKNESPYAITPNIDNMVTEGVRFNRFYSCPNCSPTRASVMTGRHPFRSKVFNPSWIMYPEELTVAHVLRKAGYTTAHFGKWHLGSVKKDSPLNPHNRGFDYCLSHAQHFDINPTLVEDGEPKRFVGDGSEVIVDEALKFLDERKDKEKPFFMCIWYGSPHGGYRTLPEDEARFKDVKDKKLRGYLTEILA